MKVLHLYSDWKWTGPSEPILNLCRCLSEEGVNVHLACLGSKQPIPSSKRTLPAKAKEYGIKTLLLPRPLKYLNILSLARHIRILARYIRIEGGFDIIHCHSSLDHFYAYFLRRYHKNKNIKIIRTNHKGFPLKSSYSNRFLLRYATDGYITLSRNLAEIDRKNFSLTAEMVTAIGGAVAIKSQVDGIKSGNNLRTELGIKEDDIVIGIVARVQRHRRFNIIIEAMKMVVKEMPAVKLLIIGRGTYYNELVTEPVKELNLGDNIISAGYRSSKTLLHLQPVRSEDSGEGNELRQRSISDALDTSNVARNEDYFDVINTLDFGVYLVPGSDGSCRAALEMMALGKPLIVARRGILPEIVDNEQNGLVIDDSAENLAQAILRLAKDKELLKRFSQSARLKIAQNFSLELAVKSTKDFYHHSI